MTRSPRFNPKFTIRHAAQALTEKPGFGINGDPSTEAWQLEESIIAAAKGGDVHAMPVSPPRWVPPAYLAVVLRIGAKKAEETKKPEEPQEPAICPQSPVCFYSVCIWYARQQVTIPDRARLVLLEDEVRNLDAFLASRDAAVED